MVSIILPVYNDPAGVRTTVESVRPQVTGTESELHIVDNGSTDETLSTIRDYTDGTSVYHHVENDIQSSYAARNTGIRNTDSDILAFVDADMTVSEGWLESALSTFQTRESDYMGCTVELMLPDEPTLAARYDHHTGFPIQQYLEHQQFAPTCCLFVRRDVIEDIGLFDHRLVSGGDKEFGNRVHEAGYDMHFAEDVVMYHPTRKTIPELVTKDRRVGRGLCQLQRYHPNRYGTPGIPPRPSGIKTPDSDLETRERFAFRVLSTFLTGVRGLGYYQEYVTGNRRDEPGAIPRLEQ
ncbi:glycosyltransferase family 2 protein [Natrinema pallidum]|uniref:Glycosyltransferase, type 2 n=1 Tax=Natrinema pallidum DSM 3751 TaxID=1227495 RepID=L9YP27_9EURY|nr:glycosyltransferase [Natrinema pallidum]ELY75970.1 glycosyltransferase, type 2 [Natrinema pallidum DSM 3751]